MADPERRRVVTPVTRRRTRAMWVLAAGLFVVLLVGGRWVALETAERAWAASIAGGDVYLEARTLARLFRGAVLLISVAWATGNLFFVYRAIGSVQMPRRLGDLEIVEAVPQRVLLAVTVASGLIFGVVMTWGTGDWWLDALLAGSPPRFGVTDPVLHRDLGYYAAALPWAVGLQNRALAATGSVTAVVALLYTGIGSLRWAGGRIAASPHAQAHLGLLLACLAAVLAWGALLDPWEVVAGLHGVVDRAAIDFRRPAAAFVTGIAVAVALVSLLWAWFGRPHLILGVWAALLAAMLLVYTVVPAAVRGADSRRSPGVAPAAEDGRSLRQIAFGFQWEDGGSLPAFPSAEAAIAAVPLWDERRIASVLRIPVGGVALQGSGARGRPSWLVAPKPDEDALEAARPRPSWTEVHRGAWSHADSALTVIEADTGLVIDGAAAANAGPGLWFGPGFAQFAVTSPIEAASASGIPLLGWWRRTALAWVLQSPELTQRETDGLVLVWRRDVTERLNRIAPFATFESPLPAIDAGRVWWVAYGYVSSVAFPLMPATPWQGRGVRYLRAGLVGAVDAASGETRVYFAPGADSLTAAWARIFEPLVRPVDSLPPALRAQLRYPRESFDLAAAALARDHGDTATWTLRPGTPFEVHGTDGGAVWTAQGFEQGTPRLLTGLLAGVVPPEVDGGSPRLVLWRPRLAGDRLPAALGGSPETAAGTLRFWPAGGSLLSLQALYDQKAGSRDPPRLKQVYVSWGGREGSGMTAASALRDLVAGRLAPGAADQASAQQWEQARRLLAQADSALAAGDFERFGRIYADLKRLFRVGRRELAPTIRPD